MIMYRENIVREVAKATGLTMKDTRKMVNGFVDVINEFLAANNEIRLQGLGTFYTTVLPAKKLHLNGTDYNMPDTHYPVFRAAERLKQSAKGIK